MHWILCRMIRMWKAMLECHHSQYITISLAYHAKSSTGIPQGDTQREIMTQLQDKVECFGLSFANWINSHTSYVGALNGWMQNCILLPRERSKGRRAFSPRRIVGPPLFCLCQEWSAGIKLLPSEELSDSIKALLSDLRGSVEQQGKEMQKTERTVLDTSNNEESVCRDEENRNKSSNMSCVHSSLGKVLDQLTKFSEASLKMFEHIRQKSETARTDYSKCKQPRSWGFCVIEESRFCSLTLDFGWQLVFVNQKLLHIFWEEIVKELAVLQDFSVFFNLCQVKEKVALLISLSFSLSQVLHLQVKWSLYDCQLSSASSADKMTKAYLVFNYYHFICRLRPVDHPNSFW